MTMGAFSYPLTGSLTDLSLQQAGGVPGARLIGCRTGLNGEFSTSTNFTNTNFWQQVESRHVLPYGATEVRVVYGGFAKTNGSSFIEAPVAPAVWRVASGTLVPAAGGSAYVVGDIITGPTGTTIPAPWVARVLSVSAGAITKVQVIKPGIYTGTGGPPADGMAVTGGTGSGATFNAQWEGFAGAAHLSMSVNFTPVLSGPGALELLKNGPNYQDATEAWDLYIPCGDIVVSKPIKLDLPPGAAIWIRGEIIGANMQCGRPVIASEVCVNASSFFERANSTIVLTPSQANNLCQPLAIIGVPKIVGPSLIILGDSRIAFNGGTTGTGSDTMDGDGNWGWLERAIASRFPSSSYTRSSDQLGNYINATVPAAQRGCLASALEVMRPTAAYINLSINDFINGGRSAATVQAWETQMISFLRSHGIQQVFTDTCDPNTTSSDSWATLANQTVSSGGAQAVLRNQALRAGGYPGSGQTYDFFIDNQGITEDNSTGTPSGKWIPGTTADGMHQTQTVLAGSKAANAAAILPLKLSVK